MKIMLDVETLGSSPGSFICAVGAVAFGQGKITAEFYQRVDPEDCARHGLRIEASTVLWWMRQNDEARSELCRPGLPLLTVLTEFAAWLGDGNKAEIWGNGASFDQPILDAAYRACALTTPWVYYNCRCYRTIKAIYPEIVAPKNAHNALEDARNQANHLMQLMPGL